MKINFFNQTNIDAKEYISLIKSIFKQFKTKEIMNVVFVSPNEIQRINREYRTIDRITDVISFANNDENDLIEESMINDSNLELGDIFICLERAFSQANEYGHSNAREVGFLSVHGFLHLKGYDHMTKEDEEIMFTKQDEILNNAGLKRSL